MPTRPKLTHVVRMARGLAIGSAIDRPRSLLGVLGELRGDTPGDSPLTLKTLMARDDYRDLRTPKVAPGHPAFDFELPALQGTQPGQPIRLRSFRGVMPVALIFGSYT